MIRSTQPTPTPGPYPAGPVVPAPVYEVPLLDADRLEVYRVALEFQAQVIGLVPRGLSFLRDQLARASSSIVLNIAEGAGRRSPRDKAQFYGIARGSAMECAAVLDILRVRGAAPITRCQPARALLVRIVQMLTRLEQRMTRE